MEKLPRISFWKERVTDPRTVVAGHPNQQIIYAVHACRNWDVPSNGVFLLFTHEELYSWDKRIAWRDQLEAALKARERRLVSEYQRRVRHHLTDYFDDEIWVPA